MKYFLELMYFVVLGCRLIPFSTTPIPMKGGAEVLSPPPTLFPTPQSEVNSGLKGRTDFGF